MGGGLGLDGAVNSAPNKIAGGEPPLIASVLTQLLHEHLQNQREPVSSVIRSARPLGLSLLRGWSRAGTLPLCRNFPVALLAGELPQRQQRLVEAWAELHQDELVADWQLLQEGRRPAPIAPLR